MDLSAVIAELNEIAAKIEAETDPGEIAALNRRRKELQERSRAVDAVARRLELERELDQLERRLSELDDSHIRHRKAGGGFLRGALWGDYDFPKHAEKLNAGIDDGAGRDRLEARVAELRDLLGLT